MTAGVDSRSGTELTRALAERLNVNLPSTLLFDHPSVIAIARFVAWSDRGAKPEDVVDSVGYISDGAEQTTKIARPVVPE
mmetsp:Transcript_3457/g.13368  ORF Transcript_3457/g.13368 Transcript_3457/m.13368 type:complete len:80 (-) Transcript_3457:354-593(-)